MMGHPIASADRICPGKMTCCVNLSGFQFSLIFDFIGREGRLAHAKRFLSSESDIKIDRYGS